MTIKLSPVGFFRELSVDKNSNESINDAVRPESSRYEREIAAYLQAGITVVDTTDTSTDVLSKDTRIQGASTLMTDGKWVWRNDLSHYVLRYHLQLDPSFVADAERAGFRIPVLIDSELETVRRAAVDFFTGGQPPVTWTAEGPVADGASR